MMDDINDQSVYQPLNQIFNQLLDNNLSARYKNLSDGNSSIDNEKPSLMLKDSIYTIHSNPDYITGNLILYYCAILIFFGTLGNILSIMVFSRKGMKSSTMSVYTRFMALNDLAALYTGPLHLYIYYCYSIDITILHSISCKLYYYRVLIFTDISAYMIVCLTSERLLSVLFPHKVRLFCSKKVSYYTIAFVVFFLGTTDSPVLWFSQIVLYHDNENGKNETKCMLQPTPNVKDIWYTYDLVKFTIFPVAFITVANIILLLQLYGPNRCRRMADCCRKGNDPDIECSDVSRTAKNRKQVSITLTLVCVSVVFFICNFPVVLFPFISIPDDYDLAYLVTILLMYTNNGLNFLLYCACGTRFRKELMAMLCFQRESTLSNYSSSAHRKSEKESY